MSRTAGRRVTFRFYRLPLPFPGRPATAHWGMPDPAAVQGDQARRRACKDAVLMLSRRIDLLLALPIVPAHAPGDCQQPDGLDEPEPSEDEVTRSNPFSVLAQLKRDPNV